VLYPAVHALVEKALAASKSVRPFGNLEQSGYRCTLCGEREWLTHDRELLMLSPGQRKDSETTFVKLVDGNRDIGTYSIKKGEHLCGVCTLKRLWPVLFTDRVSALQGRGAEKDGEKKFRRYVISTHTMALATTIEKLLDKEKRGELNGREGFEELSDMEKDIPVALPRKLSERLREESQKVSVFARYLPSTFDRLREEGEEGRKRLAAIERKIEKVLGAKPENYYALILMDGDRMGAWISGSHEGCRLPFRSCWHPQIERAVNGIAEKTPDLKEYLDAPRAPSPARHAAISQALNSFSSRIVPHVVERLFKGKLLYSGGDDVLAMMTIDDLLEAMLALRLSYSGIEAKYAADHEQIGLTLGKGFGKIGSRQLYQLMGERATASMGAVLAHHQTPLALALRELRQAESDAKNAGRNAFCIKLLKRSGGAIKFVSKWWPEEQVFQGPWLEQTAIKALMKLKGVFALDAYLSRRAAYSATQWLLPIPDDAPEMAELLLLSEFSRHCSRKEHREEVLDAARCALRHVIEGQSLKKEKLIDMLGIAEFLARESRAAAKEVKS